MLCVSRPAEFPQLSYVEYAQHDSHDREILSAHIQWSTLTDDLGYHQPIALGCLLGDQDYPMERKQESQACKCYFLRESEARALA